MLEKINSFISSESVTQSGSHRPSQCPGLRPLMGPVQPSPLKVSWGTWLLQLRHPMPWRAVDCGPAAVWCLGQAGTGPHARPRRARTAGITRRYGHEKQLNWDRELSFREFYPKARAGARRSAESFEGHISAASPRPDTLYNTHRLNDGDRNRTMQ